ncbi:hypothetical protein, partial [Serratia fonticola]
VADNSTAKIDENGLTAEAGNTVANGSDVNTVQLPVKDAQGNPVPGFSCRSRTRRATQCRALTSPLP